MILNNLKTTKYCIIWLFHMREYSANGPIIALQIFH